MPILPKGIAVPTPFLESQNLFYGTHISQSHVAHSSARRHSVALLQLSIESLNLHSFPPFISCLQRLSTWFDNLNYFPMSKPLLAVVDCTTHCPHATAYQILLCCTFSTQQGLSLIIGNCVPLWFGPILSNFLIEISDWLPCWDILLLPSNVWLPRRCIYPWDKRLVDEGPFEFFYILLLKYRHLK